MLNSLITNSLLIQILYLINWNIPGLLKEKCCSFLAGFCDTFWDSWTGGYTFHRSIKLIFYQVKPLSHQSGVLTAFPYRSKRCRSLRCALGSRQHRCEYAVKTLYNRLERHAAAFILNMFKTNATAWRLHSVLDSALWGRCGNTVGSFRTPCARCGRAAFTL